MEKEFKFDDIFIISNMLDKMEFKSYIEYIDRKLEKIEDPIKKRNTALLDIIGFILTKLSKAKEEIKILCMSYNNLSEEELKIIGFRKLVPMVREMLQNGLIDIIVEQVKEIREENQDILKKTL